MHESWTWKFNVGSASKGYTLILETRFTFGLKKRGWIIIDGQTDGQRLTYKFRFLKYKNNPEANINAIKTKSKGKIVFAKVNEPLEIRLRGMWSSQ